MLVGSLTEAHLLFVKAVRGYAAAHQLDWDVQLVNNSLVHTVPQGTWWIVFHSQDTDLLTLDLGKTPCAVFGPARPGHCHCCAFDQQAIGTLAVRHFQEQGYRRLGLIADERRSTMRERQAAMKQACDNLGMELTTHNHEDPADIQSLIEWMSAGSEPLGLYAASDEQAAWLRDLANMSGLRIPEDVAILGTGDNVRHCIPSLPTLSSIAWPWFLMGQTVARNLHELMSGGQPTAPTVLAPLRVTVRESTQQRRIADPLLRKAYAWLGKHLASSQPLQQVAQHCRVAPQTIYFRFKEFFGTGPKQVHDRLRCERACTLLSQGGQSIKAVAKHSGFSSSTALGVAFKRRYGCTPRQWGNDNVARADRTVLNSSE